jgi:hypothetical protein
MCNGSRAVRQKEKIAPLGLKDNGGSAHCKGFEKKEGRPFSWKLVVLRNA